MSIVTLVTDEAAPARVEVHPDAGGRIGQITLGDRQLLRGPDHADKGWASWGWYPLVPWSNRIPDGRLPLGDRVCHLPINWPDGSAIHGLAADTAWSVTASSEHAVELHVHVASVCYEIDATQQITCGASSVDQWISIVNRAAEAVPVGIGIHPWFAVAPVEVPADEMWPGDDPLPSGPPVPVPPTDDLRSSRLAPPMDRCFTGLTAARARIGDLTLSWDGPVGHVVVYSGEPGWVCVEPVTMVNNGFAMAASGVERTGVELLPPGGSMAVTYTLAW